MMKENDMDVEGDHEILYDGKFVRVSLSLGRIEKDILIEIDRTATWFNVEEFEDLFNAVMKTKSAIEKRLEFDNVKKNYQ